MEWTPTQELNPPDTGGMPFLWLFDGRKTLRGGFQGSDTPATAGRFTDESGHPINVTHWKMWTPEVPGQPTAE